MTFAGVTIIHVVVSAFGKINCQLNNKDIILLDGKYLVFYIYEVGFTVDRLNQIHVFGF